MVSGGGRSADDTSRAVDQRLTHGQDAADEEWLRTIGSAGGAAATGVDDMDYRTIQPGVGPFNMPTNLVVSRDGDLVFLDLVPRRHVRESPSGCGRRLGPGRSTPTPRGRLILLRSIPCIQSHLGQPGGDRNFSCRGALLPSLVFVMFQVTPTGIPKEHRILYRLPELVDGDDPVIVVEGEKCVDELVALGFTATTCAFGANGWQTHYSDSLVGRDVIVWPDRDEPGRKFADTVLRSLNGVVVSLRCVESPEWLTDGGDVVDVLATRGQPEVRQLVDGALSWVPESESADVQPKNHGTQDFGDERNRTWSTADLPAADFPVPERGCRSIHLPRWIFRRETRISVSARRRR